MRELPFVNLVNGGHGRHTGAVVGSDGRLLLLYRGHGLSYGPMTPEQMRDLAFRILAAAAKLEARQDAAARQAARELEALTRHE